MNLYAATAILATIISLGLTFFVYLYNPRSPINKTAGLLGLSIGWFSLFLSLLYLTKNSNQATIYAKLLNMGAFFIPAALLHFSLTFVGQDIKNKRLILYGYLISFIFLSLISTPLIIKGASRKLADLYYPDAGPLYPLFLVTFFASWGYSEYLIFRQYKKCDNLTSRNQFKYVFVAITLGFVCGFNYIPLVMDISIPPLGGHFIFLSFALIIYSIMKHSLLNINILIRKTVIYSILIAFITTIYLLGVILIEKYFQTLLGYESIIMTIIIASAIAIFFIPVRNGVQSILDKYFFKGTLESLSLEKQRLEEEVRRTQTLKAVGTLAAGMAHEIKNPLTSIKTFTEYLPERCNDPQFIAKFQNIVVPEIEKINNIVTQLLDFAKPRPLELEEVKIQRLIDETLDLLNNDFIKYRIKAVKNYTISPVLKVDAVQMKQVFLNIILNSIDAMKEGGGELKLSINQTNRYITISIEDTGCGMNKKDLKYMFDPFFSTKKTSTGLGLSIVHAIIEKHSGRIAVDSTPGLGTCFTFYLPR